MKNLFQYIVEERVGRALSEAEYEEFASGFVIK